MNSKLLYAATVAVSLISSLALADAPFAATPMTRAQVGAELSTAITNGSLHRTDYDDQPRVAAVASGKTRAQVVVEMAEAKTSRKALIGPYANRTYNPDGLGMFRRSTLTRAEVNAEVLEAAANGTLQRTDYDDDAVPVARRANAHVASSRLAQRLKAARSRSES